jgi:hypothetical protein
VFIQVLAGPRQVGKTTLVRQVLAATVLPSHYASADDPTLRDRARARGYGLGRVDDKVACSSSTRRRRSRRGPRSSSGCGMKTPQLGRLCEWCYWVRHRYWSSAG